MRNSRFKLLAVASAAAALAACGGSDDTPPPAPVELAVPTAGSKLPPLGANKLITEADCTLDKLGNSMPPESIGLPVSSVSLDTPTWTAAAGLNQAYCTVTGDLRPIDTAAPPIKFKVALPSSWSYRGVHTGGGGMNGFVPGAPSPAILQMGAATWGSDSGHSFMDSNWAVNEEAMLNLGYMQMKKTRDAAMVILERMYGEKPRFTYWQGGSQGGREGLTVAQRFPADYDGITIQVPIVSFSTLTLAPNLIRIQEKSQANYIPPAKTAAIRTEFMRQCDKLDGLVDGVINNYQACRATFDMSQGDPARNPWIHKRCPDNIDPNPTDTTATACFTDGQISTLKFIYSKYKFATPLANDVTSFGMWAPTTDPSGSGLLVPTRYEGQEGAALGAPKFSHLGGVGVTGFLMKDLNADALGYVEGGALNARRIEISKDLDATNPDLTEFYKRGGKLLVVIGTNDSLASTGAQLDYYESVLNKMGRPTLDSFARLWVLPQTGHGLTGNNLSVDGDGKTIPSVAIPSSYDGLSMVAAWAETNAAPSMQPVVFAGSKSLPMCSYPQYPQYVAGATVTASSYVCAD
jgi:hypothetical protein